MWSIPPFFGLERSFSTLLGQNLIHCIKFSKIDDAPLIAIRKGVFMKRESDSETTYCSLPARFHSKKNLFWVHVYPFWCESERRPYRVFTRFYRGLPSAISMGRARRELFISTAVCDFILERSENMTWSCFTVTPKKVPVYPKHGFFSYVTHQQKLRIAFAWSASKLR